MSRNHLTPTQIIALNEWFKANLEIVSEAEPKLCLYRNGATDATISAQFGASIPQIAHLRGRLFGRLANRMGGPSGKAAHANLRETTRKLACLVAELSAKLGEAEYAALARRLANETTLPIGYE